LTEGDATTGSRPFGAESVLRRHWLAHGPEAPASPLRFPDGAHFRIEIPSVEGPRVLEAESGLEGGHLVAEAAAIALERVHRAAVALEWVARLRPDLRQSMPFAEGLAVPVSG
jgi:hypothetical protein